MNYKIKLLPIVRRDLQAAKKWYNEHKENLGEEFKLEVNREIDYIGKFPKHSQIKYKTLRQTIVRGYPYSIFYLIDEEKNQVVIVGVLHTSRNPEIIQRREK